MSPEPEADPAVAELLRSGRPRTAMALERREALPEALAGALFLAAALGLALGFDAEREWHAGQAVVLVALFAVASRVELDVGAGYTIPTQLVFVPMLLLLPTPWVPLLVCAGWAAGRLPAVARGGIHPSRLLLVPPNCWFSVTPALVLVALAAQTPDWSDWPVYLLALGAQFTTDVATGSLREWLANGVRPQLQVALLGPIVLIDALLSPLGLLAAFASLSMDYAFLLLVPPVALFSLFARERARRIANALELGETSARLLETERAAVRSREALIAGASHEILTPLAVALGVARRLGSLEPDRRQQAVGTLGRELLQVRHLARQFVDYTRLKAGRPVTVRAREFDAGELAGEVAAAFAARAEVTVAVEGEAVVHADPDRVEQMLMALLTNALKYAPGSPVAITVRTGGRAVEITVADRGPGIPAGAQATVFDELSRGGDGTVEEGSGIGLFLVRTLAEAQGGSVELRSAAGEGAAFTLVLPRP